MAICEPTVEQVRAIITTGLSDAVIEALIDDAVLMVTNCVSALDCDLQTAIVKWVTAHLIASLSSQTSGGAGIIVSESLGDASTTYAKPTFETTGLKSTAYGLQAIALDPNGCLAKLGSVRTLMKVL